jgi:hypothetical protein
VWIVFNILFFSLLFFIISGCFIIVRVSNKLENGIKSNNKLVNKLYKFFVDDNWYVKIWIIGFVILVFYAFIFL